MTALFDPEHRAIDCVSRSGYTYRDSGQSLHGLQIYDWLPAAEPPMCRQVARDPGARPTAAIS